MINRPLLQPGTYPEYQFKSYSLVSYCHKEPLILTINAFGRGWSSSTQNRAVEVPEIFCDEAHLMFNTIESLKSLLVVWKCH